MNDDDVTSDASSDQNGGVGGGGLYHVTPHDTSSVLSDLDSSSNFNSVFEVNSDDFSAGANSEFNFERNPDDDVSSSSRSHSGGGIYTAGAESDSGCGGSDERRVTHAPRTAPHPCLAELATAAVTLQQPKDHALVTSIDCHSNVSVRLAKTRFDHKCQQNASANATASCSDHCSMTEKHKQISVSDFNTKWDRKNISSAPAPSPSRFRRRDTLDSATSSSSSHVSQTSSSLRRHTCQSGSGGDVIRTLSSSSDVDVKQTAGDSNSNWNSSDRLGGAGDGGVSDVTAAAAAASDDSANADTTEKNGLLSAGRGVAAPALPTRAEVLAEVLEEPCVGHSSVDTESCCSLEECMVRVEQVLKRNFNSSKSGQGQAAASQGHMESEPEVIG